MTESAVRPRYGLVSRASVSSLRRVRAHDQSSTSAPRCCDRWLPGCQTLTPSLFLVDARALPHPGWGVARRPRRRRYQPKTDASAPIPRRNATSGDFLHGGPRLDGVGEPSLEQAVLVDVAVDRTRLEQRLVRPAGDGPSLVESDYRACESDRREAVSDARELGVVEVAAAEGDVLAHRGREEERSLGDDADRVPERRELDVADVDAVHLHPARRDVVEARHERGERRLARAGVADERDRAPGGHVEVDVLEDRSAGEVLEGDVLEADMSPSGGKRARSGRVGDLLGFVHDLEDPLAGGGRPLGLPDPHAE